MSWSLTTKKPSGVQTTLLNLRMSRTNMIPNIPWIAGIAVRSLFTFDYKYVSNSLHSWLQAKARTSLPMLPQHHSRRPHFVDRDPSLSYHGF